MFDKSRPIRCDNAGESHKSVSRLASVRCPGGLAFDIERQTCDWKTNVKNCKEVESKLCRQVWALQWEVIKMSPQTQEGRLSCSVLLMLWNFRSLNITYFCLPNFRKWR